MKKRDLTTVILSLLGFFLIGCSSPKTTYSPSPDIERTQKTQEIQILGGRYLTIFNALKKQGANVKSYEDIPGSFFDKEPKKRLVLSLNYDRYLDESYMEEGGSNVQEGSDTDLQYPNQIEIYLDSKVADVIDSDGHYSIDSVLPPTRIDPDCGFRFILKYPKGNLVFQDSFYNGFGEVDRAYFLDNSTDFKASYSREEAHRRYSETLDFICSDIQERQEKSKEMADAILKTPTN